MHKMSRRIVLWEVDAQADFMLPGGKLYVAGAEKTIPNIQRLVKAAEDTGTLLVSSADAHSPDDPEFKTYPPHCVSGTPGARIIPEGLQQHVATIPNDASYVFREDALREDVLREDLLRRPQLVIEKQTLDVFDNPHTGELVDLLGADAQYIVFGVVTELCVRCAAKGLLARGREVAIVNDAIETLKPEEGHRALAELQRAGARLITTNEALAEIGAGKSASAPRVPAESSA
jgi:nicotinamidase/pyrazinamidase